MALKKKFVIDQELLQTKKTKKTTVGVRIEVEVVEKVKKKGYVVSTVVRNFLKKLAEEG